MTMKFIYFFFGLSQFSVYAHIWQECLRTEDIWEHVDVFAQLLLWTLKSCADKDDLVSVFLKAFLSDILTKFTVIEEFNPEVLHHFSLPFNVRHVWSVWWDFWCHQTTWVVSFFKYMDILVTQSTQEWGTRQRSRACSNDCNFGLSNIFWKWF